MSNNVRDFIISFIIAICLFFYFLPSQKIDGAIRELPIHIGIDEKFTSEEMEEIDQALRYWKKVSGDKITFVVSWSQQRPVAHYKDRILKKDSGIFWWKVSKTEEDLSKEGMIIYKRNYGVTVFGPGKNVADVIIFADLPSPLFYSVALHELGHLLGLRHVPKLDSVMYPNIPNNCISEMDVKQLCLLYDCVPREEDCFQFERILIDF